MHITPAISTAHPVATVTPQPKAQASKGDKAATSQDAAPPTPPTATKATVSLAAQAALAASAEALETPAQTAREAQHHDVQAQRLQAKELAARKAYS